MAEHRMDDPGTITPEEAARLIKQSREGELLSEREIASELKHLVQEFGPVEIDIGGKIYTVWVEPGVEEDLQPCVPGVQDWARWLAHRIAATPTDFQGHEDVPEDSALALVEGLEPEHLDRFADALFEAAPGLMERLAGQILGDLVEELHRRGAKDAAQIVMDIEEDWRTRA